jgi:uncharacterized protein (TIGR02231 family)
MADNDNKPEQVSSPRGEERKHKDKKKDKPKHSASSSNVTEKPVTPRAAENKETKEIKEPINTPAKETRTNRGPTEDVTEFLNDPKLQTGLKHKLVRKDCPIEFVTCYSDRAEVTRRIHRDIETVGVQEVILTDLLSNVVENSVRVSGGEGDAVILEVSFDRRFEAHESAESAAAKKRKELEQLKQHIETLQAELQRIQKEESWLEQFTTERIVSNETAPSGAVKKDVIALEDMVKMMSFYSQELTRVGQERLKLMNTIEDEEAKMKQLNDEIAGGATHYGEEKREVIVVLYVRSPGPISLQISYVLTGAKWASSYDFRLNSTTGDKKESSCQLVYYGSVENDSGEDWQDVQLSLSTATPSSAAKPPALKTLYASSQDPHHYSKKKGGFVIGGLFSAKRSAAPRMELANALYVDGDFDEAERSNVSVATTEVEQGATSQTYNIQRAVTVAADKKPRKVTIAVMDMSVQLHYTSIPSLAEKAYLRAKANNSSKYQLLPGSMNVFNDNVFVANSHLGSTSPGEDFDVFLGADPNIKVDFRPVRKAAATSGIITKTRTQVNTQTAIIKNLKAEIISMTVFAQLPQSEDDKIKVKLIDPEIVKDNEAVILNDWNNIRWKFSLDPNEEKKITLQYNVEYPADRELDYYSNQTQSDGSLE